MTESNLLIELFSCGVAGSSDAARRGSESGNRAHGEAKSKQRSLSEFALDIDGSRMGMNDRLAHDEAEPRALSPLFAREEGFEDVSECVPIDALTRILDGDLDSRRWVRIRAT